MKRGGSFGRFVIGVGKRSGRSFDGSKQAMPVVYGSPLIEEPGSVIPGPDE